MLLWAGILGLQTTVYRWQEQVGTVNQAIILVGPAGGELATLQQLSEIGADENKEPKPWLPTIPFQLLTASSPSFKRSEGVGLFL